MTRNLYDKEKVSKRLKELRLDQGLTQKELSIKTGISLPSIKQYETGKRIPDKYNLSLLSECFHANESYILCETDFINKWDQFEKEHPFEIKRLSHGLELISYCEYLGCTISDLTEDEWDELQRKIDEFILKTYEKLK